MLMAMMMMDVIFVIMFDFNSGFRYDLRTLFIAEGLFMFVQLTILLPCACLVSLH